MTTTATTTNTNELSGIVRDTTGKGSSHRLRRAGLLPAIVYGGGKKATSIAISPKETTKILMTPLRRNVLIHLNLQDEKGETKKTKTVMVRDLQIEPVKRFLTHVDFIEINAKAPVNAPVPLTFFGKSKSVTAGGKLDQVKREVMVRCLPDRIPVKVELDVTDLEFGTTTASHVILPEGVTLFDAPNTPVATIKQPKAVEEETPVAGAAPAAGATPAAGAAAPAAGAAKGAAPAAAATAAKPGKK